MLDGTYLGFDFGLKFIGIAVGQTITKTARPLTTLLAHQGIPDWQACEKLIQQYQPVGIVVGIPYKIDGDEITQVTAKAKQFAETLREKFSIPVFAADERLTTKSAREAIFAEQGYKGLKKEKVDALSAKIILEDWLREQV